MSTNARALSWADWLTLSRMAIAPLLVGSALMHAAGVFGALAVWGLLSDAADGVVARLLRQASERGARLDSRADFAFYSSLAAGLLWLLPEKSPAIWPVFCMMIAAHLVPIVAGWLKFRQLTSYHTILARTSLVLVTLGLTCWLWLDIMVPLRIATVVLLVSAVEELIITLVLDAPIDNVQHVGRVLSRRTRGPVHMPSASSPTHS